MLKVIVDLRGADTQGAEVISDHCAMYLNVRRDLAFDPGATRVRAAEELIGDQPIVDAPSQVSRKCTAACAPGNDVMPKPAIHVFVEGCSSDVAGADDLCGISLRGIR